MNSNEFVDSIKLVVEKSAFDNILTSLTNVSNSLGIKDKMLYEWYSSLDDYDKSMNKLIIQNAIQEAIFGFFCVLDGVRTIENGENKGELVLKFIKENEEIILNDIENEFLHDLYIN